MHTCGTETAAQHLHDEPVINKINKLRLSSLTELKAIIPKALSFERMVMVALLGVPSVTPLEEL